MTREEKTEEQLKVLVLNFAKGYVKDGDMDKEVEAMKWAESFIEKRIAEKVLEARSDELTKTFTQVIGDKNAPSSRYSKVTRIFNAYLKKRYAELQAELSKLKEEE